MTLLYKLWILSQKNLQSLEFDNNIRYIIDIIYVIMFPETFVVVDMQEWFIDNDFLKYASPETIEVTKIKVLVSRIADNIKRVLVNWWRVIIVEYRNYGPTCAEILRFSSDFTNERIFRCFKNWKWFLWWGLQNHEDQKLIRDLFLTPSFVTVWWINTNACVKEFSKDLCQIWTLPRIPLWYTLNIPSEFPLGMLKPVNNIEWVKDDFWKYSHLIEDYWEKKSYLWDYV